MNRIKIAHEAPKSIFKTINLYTDYSYALVHLFEEDPKYLELFEESVKSGREVILDNSIFELGTAFDSVKYREWIDHLKPTWYIIPDVLEEGHKTMVSAQEWLLKNRDIKDVKSIGVIQGSSYSELSTCYKFLDEKANVDMLAISFDYSYYFKSVPHSNPYVSYMLGRVKLLGDLHRDGIINTKKPHHLLGCSLPQEGLFYKESKYTWIHSVDTSNPVVHGIKKIPYTDNGLWQKDSQKLIELINTPIEGIDMNGVLNNVQKFRHFWNV